MPRKAIPIETLLLRTFLPAVIVVAIGLAIFVYDRLYGTILDGFERKLVTTSALTAAMIDPADHDRLIDDALKGLDPQIVEESALYSRNADPLRRIRSELGLTYLYTQVVGGPSDILYILDGSEGDDHSTIGSEDDLPDETLAGLRQVQTRGEIYSSPIEYQDQWGLLKTAAAPVLGRDGSYTGSAGADVNISVIKVATQNALFASAVIGIGSILACVLVSLFLVRRIARPIEGLTDETLRLAAGGASKPVPTTGPREVGELRKALEATAKRISNAASEREDWAQGQDVAAKVELLRAQTGQEPDEPVALVDHPHLRVTWLASAQQDVRALLAQLAMQQVSARISAEPELGQEWRELADLGQGYCIAVDAVAGRVELAGSPAAEISVGATRIVLEESSNLQLNARSGISLIRDGHPSVVLWPGKST